MSCNDSLKNLERKRKTSVIQATKHLSNETTKSQLVHDWDKDFSFSPLPLPVF